MAHLPMMKKKTVTGAESNRELFARETVLSSSDKCSGILHGEGVLVQQLDHISRLLHLGCYGKGIFSRSVPTHHCLPELPQLMTTRQSKRRFQTASDSAGEAAGLSSSAAAGLEWREKLRRLEEEEVKRVELHSQWKAEREKLIPKSLISTATDEQKSSHLDQGKSVECGLEEDKESDESSSVIEKSYHEFVTRVQELRKGDAYPVEEHLQLTSEEATYLAVELDILQVSSPNSSPMNTEALWTHFSTMNDRFVERYTAYRYYRSKGWVPKSGLKFGVDFLLYKQGPSFYHSTYAVVVTLIEQSLEPSLESLCKPPATGLTWREVIALDRVNEAAGKELIVCYVVKSPSLSQDQFKEPTCLASLQVREVFVKRWVPEKERQ